MSTAPVLFIGRWQPPHPGHLALVRTALDEGKDVVIAHRDRWDDDTDPYTFGERISKWQTMLVDHDLDISRVDHVLIPDISEVRYGRDVGYKVNQVSLDKDTEAISGTQIRKDSRNAEA